MNGGHIFVTFQNLKACGKNIWPPFINNKQHCLTSSAKLGLAPGGWEFGLVKKLVQFCSGLDYSLV